MKKILIIITLLFVSISAAAEEKDFTSSVNLKSLPQDIQMFIERENNCFVIIDQNLKPEEYKEFEKLYRCERLCCSYKKLTEKYASEPEKIKVIKEYTATLWKTNIGYNLEECSCPPLNQPAQ